MFVVPCARTADTVSRVGVGDRSDHRFAAGGTASEDIHHWFSGVIGCFEKSSGVSRSIRESFDNGDDNMDGF